MNCFTRIIISFLFFVLVSPLLVKAQLTKKHCENSITPDDFYAIIDTLIQLKHLDTNYDLNILVSEKVDSDKDDKEYLKTLLINQNQSLSDITYASNVEDTQIIRRPQRNIFSKEDIKYIFCIKKKYKDVRWDNSRLPFTGADSNSYYTFSLPYFNLKHDCVLIKYSYSFSGSGGGGQTILLKRINSRWSLEILESWLI